MCPTELALLKLMADLADLAEEKVLMCAYMNTVLVLHAVTLSPSLC